MGAIIYVSLRYGRFLQKDGPDKARLMLRVAVTRAKQRVTIFTLLETYAHFSQYYPFRRKRGRLSRDSSRDIAGNP